MNDLISRQAAIDAANDWLLDCFRVQKQDRSCGLIRRLEDLPSAQPEIVRCKDCKHRYVDGDGVRYNVCELNHNKVQSDEWFCADGERKDGESDG